MINSFAPRQSRLLSLSTEYLVARCDRIFTNLSENLPKLSALAGPQELEPLLIEILFDVMPPPHHLPEDLETAASVFIEIDDSSSLDALLKSLDNDSLVDKVANASVCGCSLFLQACVQGRLGCGQVLVKHGAEPWGAVGMLLKGGGWSSF